MNASPPPRPDRIASPASTGGAGTLFEQHVDAAFLALLLVRGIPPVLSDCAVTEVHLQAEHLGWATDDVLIVGVNGAGTRRRLMCQVKRSFTVSSSDQQCKDTIIDFWTDFRTNPNFSASDDRFGIIILRGTNTFLGNFAGLLDCARTSREAADFEHRLQTPGFVNAMVVRYFREIQAILNEHVKWTVPIDELWPFLKVVHALSFDLNTSTRQTETQYKTLLAHTTNASDPVGAADATWVELLREAGEGMTYGKSYQRDDLPQQLRHRHSPVADSSQTVLRLLGEHSAVILNGIRTTIGPEVYLGREQLVHSLLEKLDGDQVVIVTGPAGSGKSGIAKGAIQLLTDDFTFGFRAEEFATAHLDEVLQRAQIPANAVTLGALLAGQSRKLLLVESVERLLEASTRDAFSDLLMLLKTDRSWRLILTCRDYSSDLVRSSMLQFAGVQHSVLPVPTLDDNELNAVEASLPALSRPLSNPRLRSLLRNPYLLDKASQMEWPENRPLPEDERAFRAKFWAEIIRADDRSADDMPRRRQDACVEIALRRARALTQYVSRREIDSEAVQALRRDSLLSFSEHSDVLVAPAHDVLEDWAILRWIDEQYAVCDQSLTQLAAALGTYPAIRRTYRKWVSELVERDPKAGDRLFNSVIGDSSLSPQFRDDTLVSLLQSPASSQLLERHSASLFADNHQLLHRIIHLLRVGCVTTPSWFGGTGAVASLLHVPDGPVWAGVLRLVASNLEAFDATDLLLLLGFTEDAARGVSWQSPYPNGSESISTIAYWLLPQLDGYRAEEERKRVLQVIAKLPKCNPGQFTRLLQGDPEAEAGDRHSEELRELVLWDMEGMAACRDMSDAVIAAVRDELMLTEDALRAEYSYWGGMDIEPAFGIREGAHFHSFPASAYHGPFLHLLRFHPEQGIALLLELFNHSVTWYAARRVPMQFVEPPFEITPTFADGTTRTQWCNSRLWNLYRGTSVGPYVLQSTLMALEQWLLAFGEARPEDLDARLCDILRRTASSAVTAVVASVATAFTRATPETILVLLSSPACVLLDRARLASESQAAAIGGLMPFRDAAQRVYDDERKRANTLPHRRHDLETAIANVQLGPHRERVQGIIDGHRLNMPPVDEQSEDGRVWRLSLHRMDLRQYTVASPYREERERPAKTDAPDETERRMIRLDLREADPDVQQMVESSTRQYAAMNARMSLLMWGIKVFSREEEAAYDPSQWKSRLDEARGVPEETLPDDPFGLGRGGPEFVASVCIRDHFDEMTADDAAWCIETVCNAVESQADDWNDTARVQRYSMGGDRPSAWVLSSLVRKVLSHNLQERLRNAFACALLHPIDEVRAYAASGVGQHLWSTDPQLAIRCINVLATEAKIVQQRWSVEKARPFDQRVAHGQIELEVAMLMRSQFYGEVDEQSYEQLDVTEWTGSKANWRILSILCRAPEQQRAVDAFRRLGTVIVEWWDADNERRGNRGRERSSDVEIALTSVFEEFVLNVSPEQGEAILEPVLHATDRHPRNTSQILEGIVGFEDRVQKTEQFWYLWELFANRVRAASWLLHIDTEHPSGGPMMAAIFLTQYWKDDARHWRSLEGHAFRVHRLFEALLPSATILDDYVRFLYHIGNQSLPMPFQLIAKRLQAGDAQAMLRMRNTVFMLETLLRRYVYGRPMELKRDRDLRESILYLLDTLVESGSSSAYRMRDDFVTPIQ